MNPDWFDEEENIDEGFVEEPTESDIEEDDEYGEQSGF